MKRLKLGIVAALVSAMGLSPLLAAPPAAKPPVKGVRPAVRPLTEDQKIVHVLNRLGYGPRPGDIQRVKSLGLQNYIAEQLMPEGIDDSSVERQMQGFPMLALGNDQLVALYQARTLAYRDSRKLRKQQIKVTGAASAAAQASLMSAPAASMTAMTAPAAGDETNALNAKAAARRAARAQASPETRREARAARQALQEASAPVAQAQAQLVAAKMLRAVESERQLQEVLVDFWSNHFNIDIRKQSCGILKIADDRDVIRPHVFGRFRDLLGASAKSPAMLVYLDNFQSTREMPPARPRPAQAAPAKKNRGGLNENYAREIMELHTLGVDGGYTQKDVTEVARCFTGWSIGMGDAGGRARGAGGKSKYAVGTFQFYPARHDDGAKTVLGHVIAAGGGESDGEQVLDILASHPATMRHISYELCQRLVSDNPPDALVDRCVAAWKRTDGDLREVTRTIVTSPEFFAPAAYRSKIKSPFEYAVSSVRALGGTYHLAAESPDVRRSGIKPPKGGGYLYLDTVSLIGQVGTMGEPLFQYQAPTGYPEESRKWVSSGALISRMNFSLALTGGHLADVTLPERAETMLHADDPDASIDRFAQQILHTEIAPVTKKTMLMQLSAVPSLTASTSGDLTPTDRLAALLLGSPEFQRR